MAQWSDFAAASPRLSAFVAERLTDPATGRLSYLATLRPDGGPRVHPVVAFVTSGRLWVFSFQGSPKAADLLRDPRYAVHLGVTADPFVSGEAAIRGRATRVDDAATRAAAVEAAAFAMAPGDDAILFELGVDLVSATFTGETGPTRLRWREGEPAETELPLAG